MTRTHAVVVTTINAPTRALLDLQSGAAELDADLYVIGDTKSPADFSLTGALWFDVEAQRGTGLAYAQACPTKHYARKNIGYLLAIQDGVEVIRETDDDNIPRDGFFRPRVRRSTAEVVAAPGWCNAYGYFSDAPIWPRGLPLDRLRDAPPPLQAPPSGGHDCPVHQGLADENPDVDAIYRLVLPLPQNFRDGPDIVLAPGAWCPFNSQNTTFWRDAFPLLYLPYHCSFRMTDIWRSFVAQRLMWECGWALLFHGPTVWQERNAHDLMRDFAEEVPGYLHNSRIREVLDGLSLAPGSGALASNLVKAYDALIDMGVVGAEERPLLRAWLADLEGLGLA